MRKVRFLPHWTPPGLSQKWNFEKVNNSLYSQLAFTCLVLTVLLLQDSQEISEETFRVSHFEGHKHLKIWKVAHKREAFSVSCIIELLKFSNNRVLLDIWGHHLKEFEFQRISKKHPDALACIVGLDDYVNMLYQRHTVSRAKFN